MAISCDPGSLVRAAKCFACIPKQARRWVRNFLLCQVANKSGNKVALVGTHFGGIDSAGAHPASLSYSLGGVSVTSGNTVLVGVALVGAGLNNFTAAQLTKTAGTATIGTIALDSNKNEGAGDLQCAIYRVPVTGSGTITLTYANGVTAFILIGAAEFSGLNASPVDAADSLFGNAQLETSNAIASSVPGLIFYVATEDASLPWVRSWSDTLIYNQTNGVASPTGIVQFKLVNSSPNTLTSTTEAPAITWLTVSQAYKSS